MKMLVLALLLVGVTASAEESDNRGLAGEKDMTKDYLESAKDEKAAEKDRRAKLRKEHEDYLRTIQRSR